MGPVPPGSTYFLDVTFETSRQAKMDNKPHICLVYTHTERNG